MASSTSYEPDGFDAANLNPFAQESPLSQSVWGSSELDNEDSSFRNDTIEPSPFQTIPSSTNAKFESNDDQEQSFQSFDTQSSTAPSTESPLLTAASSTGDHPQSIDTTSESQKPDPTEPRTPTATTPADTGVLGNPQKPNSESSETTTKPQPSADKQPKKKYKLIFKVTGLERNGKKDPIIKFDAYTTLPRFRTNTYRDIRRTHHEFVKFGSHLNNANPECFVPSVPPSFTSAGIGTEEDESRVQKKIQLWLDRVSSNPVLARDEELIHFIESDFGYSPVYKKKPPASGMARKALKQLNPPHDEVTELAEFRPVVKQLYVAGQETTAKVEKVSKARRALGLALNDFGTKLAQISTMETQNPGMVPMWRKLGKTVTGLGDLEAVKATSEAVTLTDGINEIIQDAYVAKEALTNRHLIMRELAKAQANTKSKHQTAVKLRGSANINPAKVDEAIAALDDATYFEETLTNKVRRVTENMLIEKRALSNRIETDIRSYIAEYVVRLIDSERRALSAWESIRPEVRATDSNGGLSRLGRESKPTRRRPDHVQSQGAKGDAWSGDRKTRAKDFSDSSSFHGSASAPVGASGDKADTNVRNRLEKDDNPDGQAGVNEANLENEDDDKEPAIPSQVDARSAASLLGGTTF